MKYLMTVLSMLVVGGGLQAWAGNQEQDAERKQERRKTDRPKVDAQFFERLDTNKDGVVTLDEIPEDRRERARALIERLDGDKDGKVTRAEFDAGAERFRRAAEEKRPERPQPPEKTPPREPQAGDRPGQPGQPARPGQPPGDRPGQPGRPGQPPGRPFGPEGRPGPGGGLFGLLDADRDGKLTRDELAKAADAIMKRDRDGDGAVTIEEVFDGQPPGRPGEPPRPGTPGAAARPEGAPQPGAPPRPDAPGRPPLGGPPESASVVLGRLDANKDGKLSESELPERMRGAFARMDSNGDGAVDEKELGAAMTRMRAQRGEGAPGTPPSGRPNPESERAVRANRERVAGLFREHDKDADGRLSKDEFPADRKEDFAKIDSDGDGFVTPIEFAQSLGRPAERRPDRKPEDKPRGGESRDGDNKP